MSNTAIWDVLKETNPAHTKQFKRSGGFQGTAISPTYQIQRMTEQFGPIGIGWYYEVINTSIEHSTEGHVVVFRDVNLYFKHEGEWSKPIHGCGGDFIVGKNKYGLNADDEAFKKAETDALGNAMKKLGMSADIHLGMHDDNKYVNDLKAKYAEEKPKQELKQMSKEEYDALAMSMLKAESMKDLGDAYKTKVALAWERLNDIQQQSLLKIKDDRKAALLKLKTLEAAE